MAETDKDGVVRYIKENSGIEKKDLWINACFPADKVLLQGNYLGFDGIGAFHVLEYSLIKNLHLRDALLKEMKFSKGLYTLILLNSLMTFSSWNDFEFLRNSWPDAAIELSIYSHNVGKIPNRNTMFWEVRHY